MNKQLRDALRPVPAADLAIGRKLARQFFETRQARAEVHLGETALAALLALAAAIARRDAARAR